MKKYLFYLLLSVIPFTILSQSDGDTISPQVTDIKFDMLKSPTNPAFLVMNTSPTEIVEPGSTPEFISSLQNASSKFTALPNNYAFGVTPFWWGKGAKKLSFDDDFQTEKNDFTFYRTLSISGGVVQVPDISESLWRYGLGIQTTLLRGKVDKNKKESYFKKLRAYHKAAYVDMYNFLEKNDEYNAFVSKRDNLLIQLQNIEIRSQNDEISDEVARIQKGELVKKLEDVKNEITKVSNELGNSEKFLKESADLESNKELDKKFNEMNERVGLKWDIGAGLSINSIDNNLDSTGMYRAGFWSNFGGNLVNSDSTSSNLAGFLLFRYLYFNEINYMFGETTQLLTNVHTFDLGAKLQYEVIGKFTIGVELIYRTSLSSALYENTYKLNGMLQYSFGNNKMVYASIGNNFNDTSTTDPNKLIFIIGLNIGFGGNIDLYETGL